MASERSNDVTTQKPSIDRRAAVKGALAAAGALGLGSLAPSAGHAQQSAAPAATAAGATLALTRFLNTTAYADLPPLAIEHAKMILASTLSSAAVGITMDSARIQRDLALDQGGKAESTVWFHGPSCRPCLPRASTPLRATPPPPTTATCATLRTSAPR